MTETRDQLLMQIADHQRAVHEVVSEAMRTYAVAQTGNPHWRRASFEFEAYHVMSALGQAGYRIVKEPSS